MSKYYHLMLSMQRFTWSIIFIMFNANHKKRLIKKINEKHFLFVLLISSYFLFFYLYNSRMKTWNNEIEIKKESYSTKHCNIISQSTSLVKEAPLEKPSVSLEYMQIDSRTVTSPQASIKDLSINQSINHSGSRETDRISLFNRWNSAIHNVKKKFRGLIFFPSANDSAEFRNSCGGRNERGNFFQISIHFAIDQSFGKSEIDVFHKYRYNVSSLSIWNASKQYSLYENIFRVSSQLEARFSSD